MISRRLKEALAIVSILGILGTSVYIGGRNTGKVIERQSYTANEMITPEVKVLQKDLVIDKVSEMSVLKVLQSNVTKSVKIEQGKYFKKSQNIAFKMSVNYSIDLGCIDAQSVIVVGDNVIIYTKPLEVEVVFREDETVFEDTEKMWFTVGDVKLTTEEFESIKSRIKQQVLEESLESDEYTEAVENVGKNIAGLLTKFTDGEVSVDVRFIK